jgi:hypothetical protein
MLLIIGSYIYKFRINIILMLDTLREGRAFAVLIAPGGGFCENTINTNSYHGTGRGVGFMR